MFARDPLIKVASPDAAALRIWVVRPTRSRLASWAVVWVKAVSGQSDNSTVCTTEAWVLFSSFFLEGEREWREAVSFMPWSARGGALGFSRLGLLTSTLQGAGLVLLLLSLLREAELLSLRGEGSCIAKGDSRPTVRLRALSLLWGLAASCICAGVECSFRRGCASTFFCCPGCGSSAPVEPWELCARLRLGW